MLWLCGADAGLYFGQVIVAPVPASGSLEINSIESSPPPSPTLTPTPVATQTASPQTGSSQATTKSGSSTSPPPFVVFGQSFRPVTFACCVVLICQESVQSREADKIQLQAYVTLRADDTHEKSAALAGGLSGGDIAGIVIGVLAAVAVAAAIALYVVHRQRSHRGPAQHPLRSNTAYEP